MIDAACGFIPNARNNITIRCPICDKQKMAFKLGWEPMHAEFLHLDCPEHSESDPERGWYADANGTQIGYFTDYLPGTANK
jgi:hypothetical protein